MTAAEQHIVKLMLKGHFLRQQKRGKKTVYVIYDEKINPISRVKPNFIKSLTKTVPPKIELFKRNNCDDISLNLSMVRRLHGNHLIKRFYKKRKELDTAGAIYKKRKSTKKNIKADEKIYSLF